MSIQESDQLANDLFPHHETLEVVDEFEELSEPNEAPHYRATQVLLDERVPLEVTQLYFSKLDLYTKSRVTLNRRLAKGFLSLSRAKYGSQGQRLDSTSWDNTVKATRKYLWSATDQEDSASSTPKLNDDKSENTDETTGDDAIHSSGVANGENLSSKPKKRRGKKSGDKTDEDNSADVQIEGENQNGKNATTEIIAKKPYNPINMFSPFPPPLLRDAQRYFEKSINSVEDTIQLMQEIITLEGTLKIMMLSTENPTEEGDITADGTNGDVTVEDDIDDAIDEVESRTQDLRIEEEDRRTTYSDYKNWSVR